MKIFAAILLLLILVLLVPVRLYVNSAPEITVTVKYFWFKKGILPKGEKRAKKKDMPKKPKTEKKKARKKRQISYTLQEVLDLLQMLRHRASPSVRRLLRRTTVAKFRLRMIVAGQDAADTAIKFGKVNAQVFTAVALVAEIIRLKADQIEILPGFGVAKSETSYSGEMRLSPLALLVAGAQIGFWSLVSAVPLYLKSRKNNISKKTAGGDAAEVRKEDQNGKETPLERGA